LLMICVLFCRLLGRCRFSIPSIDESSGKNL